MRSLCYAKPAALHISQCEECALIAGDVNVAQEGILDVLQRDAFAAGAGDVFEDESFERLLFGNLADIGKGRAGHADVRETEVFAKRITGQSLNGIIRRVAVAGTYQVDPKETTANNIKV